MNKQEFLAKLQNSLSGLPREEVEERLAFYREMIEDRMEEGLTEEEAVRAVGSVEQIVSQIVADTPLTRIVKGNFKSKRRLKVWEIILLILGSPVWFSLLVAVFAVVLSVYAALWSVIISLWAVFASLAACGFAGVVAGMIFAFTGNTVQGLVIIGAGLVCAGLSIFLFFGCKIITRGIGVLTRKIVIGIKNQLINKEEAK